VDIPLESVAVSDKIIDWPVAPEETDMKQETRQKILCPDVPGAVKIFLLFICPEVLLFTVATISGTIAVDVLITPIDMA